MPRAKSENRCTTEGCRRRKAEGLDLCPGHAGIDEGPKQRRPRKAGLGVVFTAEWNTKCVACDFLIRRGQQCRRFGERYIHARCSGKVDVAAPPKARRVCSVPGCQERTEDRSDRCERHRRGQVNGTLATKDGQLQERRCPSCRTGVVPVGDWRSLCALCLENPRWVSA